MMLERLASLLTNFFRKKKPVELPTGPIATAEPSEDDRLNKELVERLGRAGADEDEIVRAQIDFRTRHLRDEEKFTPPKPEPGGDQDS